MSQAEACSGDTRTGKPQGCIVTYQQGQVSARPWFSVLHVRSTDRPVSPLPLNLGAKAVVAAETQLVPGGGRVPGQDGLMLTSTLGPPWGLPTALSHAEVRGVSPPVSSGKGRRRISRADVWAPFSYLSRGCCAVTSRNSCEDSMK